MLRLLRLWTAALGSTLQARLSGRKLRPSWSFLFEAVIRFLRLDWEQTASWPYERLRADVARRPYPRGAVGKVKTADDTLGGVPVRRFAPRGATRTGVVVYFHGGSYIFGSSKHTHQDLIAKLALGAEQEVIGVEYRLAPEARYPAQLEDALAVYDALLSAGVRPDEIVLAGDSAGGNLALSAALALRDRALPLPRALLLFSPWSDLTMPGGSFQTNADFDFGTREVLVRQAEAFAGGIPLEDPRISPIFADPSGLPRAFVSAGEAEIPRDDILRLARRLQEAGVDVTLHVANDMPHNPPVFADFHPSGAEALQAAIAFLRAPS
jgi:epsilon-lactone hydrolase